MPGFTIHPATLDDAGALAELHVRTFNDTHGRGPSVELRESQWREKLSEDGHFAFLALVDGAPAGFASGKYEPGADRGRLDKVYVLREWHRKGIGRALVQRVVATYLDLGVTSMFAFSEANNPSIGFFERLGGQRLFSPEGRFDGGYEWEDIRPLAARGD